MRAIERRWPSLALGPLVALAMMLGCGTRPADVPPQPATEPTVRAEGSRPKPRAARRSRDVARLHGSELPDPYRWLEEVDSEETTQWVAEQQQATDEYLGAIGPQAPIRRRLEALSSYEQISVPVRRAGRLFYLRTARASSQAALVTAPALGGLESVVVDAESLASDGSVALTEFVPSDDGRLVVVATATGGSDWREWLVYDVERGTPTGDRIRWVRWSRPSWTADSRGFFYAGSSSAEHPSRRELALGNRIYYHRTGTDQSADELVLELPTQPEWRPEPIVTSNGRLLLVAISHGVGSGTRLLVRRLGVPGAPFVPLVDHFEDDFTLVGAQQDVLILLTTHRAPNGRLVAINIADPAPERWGVVVPERPARLYAATYVGHRIVTATLEDAVSQLSVLDRHGRLLRRVPLPEEGTVRHLRAGPSSDEALFSLSSFRMPPTVLRLDTRSFALTSVHRPQVAFRMEDFRTERLSALAPDGTRLPVFVTSRAELPLRAGRPTYLTGYGGFGRLTTPSFSPGQILWLELGGILATAVVRGGGELGKRWHEQGRRRNKPVAIDDFSAVADWLVAEGITSRAKLGIGGRSNGGMLVGAAMVRRPDIAAAVLADVGLFDMLRFHRIGVGWQWVDEYGSPDWLDDFEVLRRYSPYHNVRPETAYPATLISVGDDDDRVSPAHSFKLVAALQEAQAGNAPILLHVRPGLGHGRGASREQRVREATAQWLFLAHALGIELGTGRFSPDPPEPAVVGTPPRAIDAPDEAPETSRPSALAEEPTSPSGEPAPDGSTGPSADAGATERAPPPPFPEPDERDSNRIDDGTLAPHPP